MQDSRTADGLRNDIVSSFADKMIDSVRVSPGRCQLLRTPTNTAMLVKMIHVNEE